MHRIGIDAKTVNMELRCIIPQASENISQCLLNKIHIEIDVHPGLVKFFDKGFKFAPGVSRIGTVTCFGGKVISRLSVSPVVKSFLAI